MFQRDRDWFLLYFEFALHAARNPKFARRFRALRKQGLNELAAGIGEALTQAGIEASAERVARATRAATYGIALDHLIGDADDDDDVVETLALLFRGAAAAPRR
jgi:hypothetical protein